MWRSDGLRIFQRDWVGCGQGRVLLRGRVTKWVVGGGKSVWEGKEVKW